MNPLLAIFIRHGLTLAGGWLVHKGLADPTDIPGAVQETVGPTIAFAAGVISFGAGIVLSIADKVKNSIVKLSGEPKPLYDINATLAAKDAKASK